MTVLDRTFGDTQLLALMKGSDHDCAKSSDYLIVWGGKERARGL